jgi:hypothetical protein
LRPGTAPPPKAFFFLALLDNATQTKDDFLITITSNNSDKIAVDFFALSAEM